MNRSSSALVPASVMMAEPPPTWLADWGAFAAELDLGAFDDALRDQAKLVLLDCVGAIAAGMQEPETQALVRRLATAPGPGVAVGAGLRLHGGDAAFLNGVAGTMLELDEGNSYARGHPGIHVLPALLSGLGGDRIDGVSFLRAFLLGYEACARVGAAARLRPTIHPHGTWGVIGAAIGAAALEGATAGQYAETFNLSASLGLGSSLRSMLEGATVRNAYAGVAARNGLYAWDMVSCGFHGEIDGVRSVYGNILAEGFDPAVMTEKLGIRWEVQRNYFKRHAACRFTHGALDVVASLIAEHGPIDTSAIDRIEVESYAMAAQLDAPRPATMLAGKFSIPFAVATTLVHGSASVPAFRTEALTDPATLALADRVRVAETPEFTRMLPSRRPATVTITFADGRVLRGETLTNRGDADDPYLPEEVVEKFMELTVPVWGGDHAQDVHDAVMEIDTADSIGPLFEALARAPLGEMQ